MSKEKKTNLFFLYAFSTIDAGIMMQKKNLDIYLVPQTKMYPKQIIDLKVLEDYIRENVCNPALGRYLSHNMKSMIY